MANQEELQYQKPPITEHDPSKRNSTIVSGSENTSERKSHPNKDFSHLLGLKADSRSHSSSSSSSSDEPQKGSEYLTTTSLKEMIVNPKHKVNIRPVLLGLSGLPKSGKTQAITHLVKHYVDKSPHLPPAAPRVKTKGLTSYYDILALGMEDNKLDLVEMNVEHSSSFGLLSAFKKKLVGGEDVLFLPQYPNNFRVREPSFKDVVLENHLLHVYQHVCQSSPHQLQKPEGVEESNMHEQLKKRKEKLESLPKGTALVNVWNIDINKTSFLCLASLFGHFKNSNTWLFLDIDRDLGDLDQPPSPHQVNETDGTVATDGIVAANWRPKLHYLLRASRLSQGGRKDVCTIFAKHKGNKVNELQVQEKVKKLKGKVYHASKQMGISHLLQSEIQLINFNESESPPLPTDEASTLPAQKKLLLDDHTQRLYRKFYDMVCETPFKEIPLSWVFLRSLYYVQKQTFVSRTLLKEQAQECGIDDEDFEKFCRFHVSFGSIFDFTLINPSHKLIVLAPIDFMQSLDKILNPTPELYESNPMMKKGLVTETICQEIFEASCSDYMNSLISMELAAKVTGFCQDDDGLLANTPPTDTIYYIPEMRKYDHTVSKADPTDVYLITSIDSPHINMHIELVKSLISDRPTIKLVPCTEANQTILCDESTETTIKFVSFSPATKIEISTANDEVYASVVKVCGDMLTKGREAGDVKYQFINVCAEDANIITPSSIPSLHCHVLPNRNIACEKCQQEGRFDERFKAWNRALAENDYENENPRVQNAISDELTEDHIEYIVQHVATCPGLIPILAEVLNFSLSESCLRGNMLLNLMLYTWIDAYQKQNDGSGKGSKRALTERLMDMGRTARCSLENDTQPEKEVLNFLAKDLSF